MALKWNEIGYATQRFREWKCRYRDFCKISLSYTLAFNVGRLRKMGKVAISANANTRMLTNWPRPRQEFRTDAASAPMLRASIHLSYLLGKVVDGNLVRQT
jgi:hypothetical protein